MSCRIAVVGAGYWGINYVRVLAAEPRADLRAICDVSPQALQRARALAPAAQRYESFEELLDADEVEAVVIATPSAAHAELAVQALAAGKHVLVEKPLALSEADAVRVAHAAERAGKHVLVGHLMLHHPGVDRLCELLRGGELGELYYLYASRVNLGRLRHDENALWSFAPHDLSMIDALVGADPISVSARGECYLQDGVEDVVFVSLRYAERVMAHIHLSWLDPRKERRLTVVGSKKMAVFDDVSLEKLRIYDKGYERPPSFTEFAEYLTLRQGATHIPHLAMEEPLVRECRHFLDCVDGRATPVSGARDAVRIVRVLEAAQASLNRDGAPVAISSPAELDHGRLAARAR